jgi:threonine dehydratase
VLFMAISSALSKEAIAATEQLIRPHVRHTPVLEVDLSDFGLAAHPVQMKLELLQHTGSFKVRGAFANMLGRQPPEAGVVAASGGNHGAGVAYAAMKLGVPATIFVPSVTSVVKAERIKGYGATLIMAGERYADALEASERFVLESGALPIHAYDQIETLLGQGSLGMEIESDCAGLDTLLVAVGGGGLIGGVALWFAGRTRIVAVEPESAPTLSRALAAGEPVDAEAGGIAADSLAPRQVGRLMFPIARAHVARSILVSDDDIKRTQLALWERARLVAEPGGATAFSALLSQKYTPAPGERVAALVCGANTTAVQFGY